VLNADMICYLLMFVSQSSQKSTAGRKPGTLC